MLTRFVLILLLGAAGAAPGGSAEAAAGCRLLQQQAMMFQASREMGQYQRVRQALAAQGCGGGGQGFGGGQLFGRAEPERRTIAKPERRRIAEPERRTILARPSPPAPRSRERAKSAPQADPRTAPQTAAVSPRQERSRRRSEPRISVAAGTFRTLCVRQCDGYYFPISFSTTQDRFAADQASCEQVCPDAQTAIYYHRAVGEGPESMVSLEGKPYTELPAAFSHQATVNPSCSCGRPKSLDAPLATAAAELPVITAPRLPRPRGQPGEDPETLANREGGFVPRFVAGHVFAANAPEVPGGVRLVGPDEPDPVPVSPVPNDLDTSLLWDSSPS